MVYKTSDKLIAYLTLVSGLSISAVAIYYSVAGLVAIFAAAVIPIIIMGVALEISKLAATIWLKQNWSRAPRFIKGYLLSAIFILMVITSMGIFGFLSKAHTDQSLVSGDVQSKIAIYDEKIKTSKDNIEANRKALKQMDEAVDQVMGRSTDERGADKAVQIRRSQAKERARLQDEIAKEQKNIASLNEQAAPIRAEVRKVEAEVGPIKYIAKLIYGDNPDQNLLEKAVTWVIIIIVIVFDPLAVILLLASQYSFSWFRQQDEEPKEMSSDLYELENPPKDPETNDSEPVGAKWPFSKESEDPHPVGWMFPRHANIQEYRVEDADDEEFDIDTHVKDHIPKEEKDIVEEIGVEQWNKMIEEAEKEVLREKEAKRQWKIDNPSDTLKHQERLKGEGIIDKLPWEDKIESEDSKKKTTYIVKENNNQITKTKD